jgi:ferredoxin
VPDKAIRLEPVEMQSADGELVRVQRPQVIRERCIGCGICECKCPLEGEAAIRIRRCRPPESDSTPSADGREAMPRAKSTSAEPLPHLTAMPKVPRSPVSTARVVSSRTTLNPNSSRSTHRRS